MVSSATYNGDFQGYTIAPLASSGNAETDTGSCYEVDATPDRSDTESYFTITLNSDGSSTKTCTNPETGVIAPGCNSSNTW